MVGLFQHLPASVSHVHFIFTQLHTFLTSSVQSQSAAPDRQAAPLELLLLPPHTRFRRRFTYNRVGRSWIRNAAGRVTDNRFHCQVLFPVCCFCTVFCSCRDIVYIMKQTTVLIIMFLSHGFSSSVWGWCKASVWRSSVAAGGGSVQSRYEGFSIIFEPYACINLYDHD